MFTDGQWSQISMTLTHINVHTVYQKPEVTIQELGQLRVANQPLKVHTLLNI